MILFLIILFISILIKNTHIKPYSFLLIVLGIVLGLINKNVNYNIYNDEISFWVNIHPKEFLFYFLPPLIYEASSNLDFHIFMKTFKIIIILTIIGVIFTTSLTYLYLSYTEKQFQNIYCLLLAIILSATDPVAIISHLSELSLPKQLTTIIEGESLLNDGLTIVLFDIVYQFTYQTLSTKELLIDIFRLSIGGILVGITMTIIKLWFLKKIYNDVVSEKLLTLISSYCSYYISEFTSLHTSGILALVSSGLIMSSYGKTRISPNSQQSVHDFWKLLSNVSNIVIFTISGIILISKISFSDVNLSQWLNLFGVYIILNIVRLLGLLIIYPIIFKNPYKFDKIDFIIVVLSGLRGEISLALALFINLDTNIDKSIRNTILFYVGGIVFLSILFNSIIIRSLINFFHKDQINIDKNIIQSIKSHINNDSHEYLHKLEKMDYHMNKAQLEEVKKNFEVNIELGIHETNGEFEENVKNIFFSTLKRTIWVLFEEQLLDYHVVHKLIEITEYSIDNISKEWGFYMNEYCNKEHIETIDIKILVNIQKYILCICKLKNILLYNRIRYNYNLIQGYILCQKRIKDKLGEMIDNIDIKDYIIREIEKSLIIPHKYITHLENKYPNILVDIETQQVSILVNARQIFYLNYLKKNGEIGENIYNKIMTQLEKKDYLLTNV